MNYFVFSNYINAWTIKEGVSRLGLTLEVMANPGLMPVSKLKPSLGDTLFFTEEHNLQLFHGSNEYHFLPKHTEPRIIDDKLYFSEHTKAIGEKPVPSWEISSDPTRHAPELPIYIKARHSWRGDQKLPRGYACHSEDERLGIFKEIEDKGWSLGMFFYQRLLQSPLINNISVSGFFDFQNEKRNLFLITRKLIGDVDKMATGLMVSTYPDPERLVNRSKYILGDMRYTGPFELEFFHEEKDHAYYLLEMNPRFWMQHGLFVSFLDNGLIKRYLGMDIERDWNHWSLPTQPLLWVNNIAFLSSLIKLKLGILKIVLKTIKQGAKACFYPSFSVSFHYVLGLILRRLRTYFFRPGDGKP
jgi:hypothetical protein